MLARNCRSYKRILFSLACLALTEGCAKRYAVRGMVLQVDEGAGRVVISHRDIPDYMPAMAMPFGVKRREELAGIYPGAQVEFRLVVGKSASHVERLRRLAGAPQDVVLPVNRDQVPIGAPMPDFALTDQLGRAVKLSDFRGRVVVVDFIYTRCPLPDVCPRLSANFARLQSRFRDRMGTDLALLSITIDPQYDTPGVLLGYAKIWNAKGDGWRFLTGPEREIESVARRFNMVYFPDEGVISHTSETGIVSRDGRLSARVNGSSFQAGQLGDLVARELDRK